jgi:hypothetical protein
MARVRRLLSGVASAVIVLAAVSAAGCGGDGRLSQQELAKQANVICTGYHHDLNALSGGASFEGLERFAQRARPILQQGIDDLRELKPPKESEEIYTAWIDQTARDLTILDRTRRAARRHDQAELDKISADVDVLDRLADRMANQLGLTACAD